MLSVDVRYHILESCTDDTMHCPFSGWECRFEWWHFLGKYSSECWNNFKMIKLQKFEMDYLDDLKST